MSSQRLLAVSTALKVLLFPSYRSTDFDVHRNWLRIAHDLPLKDWYYDVLSEWTLDYPPFFAYFEKLLSSIASLFDPSIASSQPVNFATVAFSRSSVILSELLLLSAAYS